MALVPAAYLPGRWGENLSNVSNVSGSAAGVASAGLDRRRAAVLGLLLLAAPLLAMSLAKDRFERYMVPMTAGAAVLAAVPLVVLSRGVDERHGNGRGEVRAGRVAVAAAVAMHWLVLVGLYASIGFAAGSSLHLRGVAGRAHWAAAAMAAGVGLAVAGAGLLWQRRWRGAVVAVTAIGMAGFQIGYYRLEARGAAAQSTLRPVADLVWQKYPDAEIYAYRPDRPYVISAAGNDLSIHLNRTLRWETDPSTVPPSSHPQVFVIYRPRVPGRPPLRPPPGWKLLAKPPGLEDRYVFVRPGTPP
jgi:hypothetical protein